MTSRFEGRKHPRLAGYDYRLANTYFVTFITHASAQLLGTVTADGVLFSDAGDMVDQYIFTLSKRFPRVTLHEWIVTPDHVHLLLTLMPNDSTSAIGASLSDVIQWLKTMTTNAYIRGVKDHGWTPFDRKMWLRASMTGLFVMMLSSMRSHAISSRTLPDAGGVWA